MATTEFERSGEKSGSTKQNAIGRQDNSNEDFQYLVDEVSSAVSAYCRERPMVAGIALFAFGFYVGWRVKPW